MPCLLLNYAETKIAIINGLNSLAVKALELQWSNPKNTLSCWSNHVFQNSWVECQFLDVRSGPI